MSKNVDLSELVAQAKLGEREHMDALARAVEPRLRAYLFRTVLDKELTDDLVQDTLLQMVKSLKNLQKIESFWAWLFQIASSKTSQLLRTLGRKSAVHFSALEDSLLERLLRDDSQEAVSSLVRRELGELIFKAASKLKYRQRAVLSLRCFEGMSYVEIAETVGCKETEARVSFFRAKQALKKQLSRRGFSKSSLLLALILFGKVTAPSEAAALGTTVEGAMLGGVGVGATIRGLAEARRVAMTAAAGVAVAVAGWSLWPESVLNRGDVRSVHYIVQGVRLNPGSSSSSSSGDFGSAMTADLVSMGAYENWQYFPEGPDGAVLRREQRWSIDGTERQCSWLQDGKANYYYYSGKKTLYKTNDPLRVLLLPTDPPEFAEFLMSQCGRHSTVEWTRDPGSGLPVRRVDNRVAEVKDFKTTYEYNKLDAKFFEYGWPEGTKVVDARDEMHKRGWTYFRIEGRVGERDILGRGRMPFVYAMREQHGAWLDLETGTGQRIVDSGDGAYLVDSSGTVTARYPAGSFFKGLGRPWMGIRAYDTVRRDAAEKRIEFNFEQIAEGAWVELRRDEDYSQSRVSYFVDTEKDLIQSIGFSISGGPELIEGTLKFWYPESLSDARTPFVETPSGLSESEPPGILWLLQLAEGKLGAAAVQ